MAFSATECGGGSAMSVPRGVGCDRAGFDCAGSDRAGSDRAGFDCAGSDRAGFDCADHEPGPVAVLPRGYRRQHATRSLLALSVADDSSSGSEAGDV
jgi:hypothetical protein